MSGSRDLRDVIYDTMNNRRYLKGRFLGKGGFAKCYELTDLQTKEIFAGKIVPKSALIKQHHREKMIQEIQIHRSVRHHHIVGFNSYFEDDENVYIVLELCRRRSLMELHKRRSTVTEPECRYFVKQVALACQYLHELRVIHRDLKLGNLFLNDDMEIKIGDFGLATRLDYDGERKKTLCGTPNYIAPEILSKKGHSYEVDSWSLGCIIYTLLVGKPPFETPSLRDTYGRITRNEYHVPSSVSSAARGLIRRLLHPDPLCRPTMEQVLTSDFLLSGYLPAGLPTSCLSTAPHFDTHHSQEFLLKHVDDVTEAVTVQCTIDSPPITVSGSETACIVKQDEPADEQNPLELPKSDKAARSQLYQFYLAELLTQLTTVIETPTLECVDDISSDDAEDPAAIPIYWVSKWVDYSDKYGLGYQLCDNSVGVLFNDSTRILLTSNGENMQYIERDGTEHFHTLKTFPDSLTKKVTLLKYFRNYMQEHLLKAGADIAPRQGDELTRLPFLRTWFRTRSAIVLHLSNGTLQINFFQDHTKVILCPLMGAVTFIDDTREAHTYRFQLVTQFGCNKALASRLRYAHAMVQRLLAAKSSKPRSTAQTEH